MIDQIVCITMGLKQSLITLGYALPPTMWMHNNKLRQIDMDFRQMSDIMLNRKSEYLFENASNVFTALTSEYSQVTNLSELLREGERVFDYVASY